MSEMSKDELAVWEPALAHIRQARESVARLHDRLVREGVVQAQQAWGPLNSLDFAVSSLETARRKRGPCRKTPQLSHTRREWGVEQGGLCNPR